MISNIEYIERDGKKMNQDVGKKIKDICQAIEVIQIICCCILGISFASVGAKILPEAKTLVIVLGLVIAGVGSLQCWMRGLTLYAYGEITDRITRMEEVIAGSRSVANEKAYEPEVDQKLELWRCTYCGMWNSNRSDTCSQCGRKKE